MPSSSEYVTSTTKLQKRKFKQSVTTERPNVNNDVYKPLELRDDVNI